MFEASVFEAIVFDATVTIPYLWFLHLTNCHRLYRQSIARMTRINGLG